MSDELLMDNYLQTCRKHSWGDFQVERTWEKIAKKKERKTMSPESETVIHIVKFPKYFQMGNLFY